MNSVPCYTRQVNDEEALAALLSYETWDHVFDLHEEYQKAKDGLVAAAFLCVLETTPENLELFEIIQSDFRRIEAMFA